MKINKIISITLLVLLCSCNQKKNDLIKKNLNGNIKRIVESHFNVIEKFGEIIKDEKDLNSMDLISSFNEDGYLIQYEIHNSHFNELYSKYRYSYDEEYRVITEELSGKNVNYKKITYKYNDELQTSNYYDLEGNLVKVKKSKYDKNGNLIETSSFNTNGDLTSKYLYKYDEMNNETEVAWYDKEGGLINKECFEYDKNNFLIKAINYDSNSSETSKFIYENDIKGIVIKEISYYLGDLRWECAFKYEFDDEGNWIKRTTYMGNIPVNQTIREITYY